jgi:acylphosphatase
MDTSPIERRRFVVRGRVQGVGFRYFVVRRANELGLGGWVRNLPDGESVEAVAQGTAKQLDAFAHETMRTGPPGALVTACEEWAEPVAERFEGFTISG